MMELSSHNDLTIIMQGKTLLPVPASPSSVLFVFTFVMAFLYIICDSYVVFLYLCFAGVVFMNFRIPDGPQI